jgi:hypothetical protein
LLRLKGTQTNIDKKSLKEESCEKKFKNISKNAQASRNQTI